MQIVEIDDVDAQRAFGSLQQAFLHNIRPAIHLAIAAAAAQIAELCREKEIRSRRAPQRVGEE